MAELSSNPNPLSRLPDELLESITLHLSPAATLSFGSTDTRNNKITFEPLVWRRHCIQQYRYWDVSHDFLERIKLPPAQTKWRALFNDRRRIDREALEVFNELLETQQYRVERMEKVAKWGLDVKDLMLKLKNETPDDAEDVLARRYYANAILGQIHRATALDKWLRLQRMQMVRLEEILGAYDVFVLNGSNGDLDDLDRELDRIAEKIRARDPEFDALSVRKKAVQIAKYLRSENLVGNPDEEDYHALRNNFISIALFQEPHTSLPLQSVAIYCAIARRLGVNAKLSNYPHHVHAIIEAPPEASLDGVPRTAPPSSPGGEAEAMYMDPWRSSEEIPRAYLTTRLSQMGAPIAQHASHLNASSTLEIALRTSRNIMNSVQEARDRNRNNPIARLSQHPDIEAAWYSMLWSMLVLGDSQSASTAHRRRQCLPYLIEHYQAHFPEDIGLVETLILPMFMQEREHHVLSHLIDTARTADRTRRAPSLRPKKEDLRACMIPGEGGVAFKIGTPFRHKRYDYRGIIVGWDVKCTMEPRWIEQMRVDELPRGREQPFYNVVSVSPANPASPSISAERVGGSGEEVFYYVLCCADGGVDDHSADDKSIRYVAEENVDVLDQKPEGEGLWRLAGRYFKRWDEESKRFVSNMRDEYPDD